MGHYLLPIWPVKVGSNVLSVASKGAKLFGVDTFTVKTKDKFRRIGANVSKQYSSIDLNKSMQTSTGDNFEREPLHKWKPDNKTQMLPRPINNLSFVTSGTQASNKTCVCRAFLFTSLVLWFGTQLRQKQLQHRKLMLV